MFWRRGPSAEEKAEAVAKKRANNDEVAGLFMECRAISLQSLQCYAEHGQNSKQCQRGMEEENTCWGCTLAAPVLLFINHFYLLCKNLSFIYSFFCSIPDLTLVCDV